MLPAPEAERLVGINPAISVMLAAKTDEIRMCSYKIPDVQARSI